MTLVDYGISERHVHSALYEIKQGAAIPDQRLSRTTYLIDPSDATLWDLKAVLVIAGQHARPPGELHAVDFNTHDFDADLLMMGFPILTFDEDRRRSLGARGFDPDELNSPHILFEPPTGAEIRNGLSPIALSQLGATDTRRREVTGMRIVRNSRHVTSVIASANGICAACGQTSFETPSGHRFLEVHHKVWLRDGGADHPNNMVALCPNCHRQEHHGNIRRYP